MGVHFCPNGKQDGAPLASSANNLSHKMVSISPIDAQQTKKIAIRLLMHRSSITTYLV